LRDRQDHFKSQQPFTFQTSGACVQFVVVFQKMLNLQGDGEFLCHQQDQTHQVLIIFDHLQLIVFAQNKALHCIQLTQDSFIAHHAERNHTCHTMWILRHAVTANDTATAHLLNFKQFHL